MSSWSNINSLSDLFQLGIILKIKGQDGIFSLTFGLDPNFGSEIEVSSLIINTQFFIVMFYCPDLQCVSPRRWETDAQVWLSADIRLGNRSQNAHHHQDMKLLCCFYAVGMSLTSVLNAGNQCGIIVRYVCLL